MKKIKFLIVILVLSLISCNNEESSAQTSKNEGYNMLLIGNSFFKPYAENLDDLSIIAGFEKHNSTRITRGGENGRPINFWNDSNSIEHSQIKTTLDEGNIDIFGMTSGHDHEDRIEGHREWINYALQNNPDIKIFIAIPQIDFPADWEQRAQEYGFDNIEELYNYFVNDIVHHEMVDQLRDEFPSTEFFTIPTGWTSVNLDKMNSNNELLDEISRFGPQSSSLFTDLKGHQGDIIRQTGSLLWLTSIYNVDLLVFSHNHGFNTNLNEIAKQIMDNHNQNYKLRL